MSDSWDIPSQQQATNLPIGKEALVGSNGIWYPRRPLFDQSVFVDISTLGTTAPTATELFPAIPGIAYILGTPSFVVDNVAAYEAVGFAGAIYGTLLDPSGTTQQLTALLGLGAGWAPAPVDIITQPGYNISAAIFSVKPAAGVAWVVVPVTRVQVAQV